MKKLSFNKGGIHYEPLKYWELTDGNFISIYQGSRGANPELDYIVKYLAPNKRLRAPSHTHWIVDLLIKANYKKELVNGFINDWIKYYDIMKPFESVEQRNKYNIIYRTNFINKYQELSQYGEFGIDFLSTLIELFIKCEKQSPGAFMFKNMMILMKEYCEGRKDFYQVISYSKRV